jgi:hypothetical protein
LHCEGIVQLKVDRKIRDTAVKAHDGVKDNFRQAGKASDKGSPSKVLKRELEGVKLGGPVSCRCSGLVRFSFPDTPAVSGLAVWLVKNGWIIFSC